ncbi:Hypothetical predicted protein [Paramuricea clavata]|uniref:Uncharacterized protein n=1 Tax=Paramuricea clavata TaxID=317549 RepID=A0A7D9IY03_PARCT|nr:Hypothetical predicted protein [Paramuricea clavata]
MSDMSEAEENVSVPTDNDLPQENPQPAHLERNETSTETSSTSKTRSGRLVKKPDRLERIKAKKIKKLSLDVTTMENVEKTYNTWQYEFPINTSAGKKVTITALAWSELLDK